MNTPPNRRTVPPRWATWLLARWGHPDAREEVLGDLLELYGHWAETLGERKANWRYAWSAVKLLRPLAQPKRTSEYSQPFFLSPTMLRNYFKIAWRSLAKNKGYSAINISGLAVGLAVALLIGLWVWDELSFDQSHKNYDRIAQVMQHQTYNGQVETQVDVPLPIGNELRTSYGSEFKHVVMASWTGNHILAFGDKTFKKTGTYFEPQAPDMLTLKMLRGTRAGLNEPASILLSASVANAFFGGLDPVGKLMKLDNDADVKVTGVYEDFPHNSTFRDVLFMAPWDLHLIQQPWIKAMDNPWRCNCFQTFVQLTEQADFDKVSAKIRDVKIKNIHKEELRYRPAVFLNPMRNWHLHSEFKNGVRTGGRIEFVWLFGSIGVFVLLLACINFMNLSTARSEKRAKEVGIRKAVGSVRSQLVMQFFSESLLVVAVAFAVSLLLVQLTLPFFNEVADKKLRLPWSNSAFWLLSLGFSLAAGLIAGSYPSLYLSSFQPVKVLKGTFRVGRLASIPRKALVVVQFTVSVALIIGTILVFRQVQFAKNRPVGYSREGLLMVPGSSEIHKQFAVIRDELKKAGAVAEMAESGAPTTAIWSSSGGFEWRGKDPNLSVDFPNTGVTHNYGKTIGWQFVAGRDFSPEFATDSAGFVVNQTAMKFIGFKNPVGETITWDGRPYKIIGVIKDMVVESPYEPVRPSLFRLDAEAGNVVNIKLNPTFSTGASLREIETVFKKINPSVPFEYKFVDQEYAKKFGDEERIGKLTSFFASLAIFISCLGIFGLASFMAEQRTREIGVRKVLGASVLNLWGLLSKDFLVLVLIGFALATPLAWYFLRNWLQNYEYRTELSWWIFAVSGLGALAVTLLTVSFQSIKAALVNPVKSLRSE